MLPRYVFLDLLRNPGRTLSTIVGISLGVGLFCGVLFFVDSLSASMTQRTVAPIAIDVQRVLSKRAVGNLGLSQAVVAWNSEAAAGEFLVLLEVRHDGEFDAHEVTIRSRPATGFRYVSGAEEIDGTPITGFSDTPFAHGPARTGFNIGTLVPSGVRQLSYRISSNSASTTGDMANSWISNRELVRPVPANQPPPVSLAELAQRIGAIDGVAYAMPLSFADLGVETISAAGVSVPGMARIFGFDAAYAARDPTIKITEGEIAEQGIVLSVETSTAIKARLGDRVKLLLPDQSYVELPVTGIADLRRARSLFNSRRRADLKSFLYRPYSVIVSPANFAQVVFPAFQGSAALRGSRFKSLPSREIDVTLDRERIDGSPSAALLETTRISREIMAVAAHQDYLLDNISNALNVAVADTQTAKRLFFFLGLPGAFLAAILASYAASVLAAAQRREQATLRVRGAAQEYLFAMLAYRSLLISAIGVFVGLFLGLGINVALLGEESLLRAGIGKIETSTLVGTLWRFLITGVSLYVTGHISIQRQINEDRTRLSEHSPFWRRAGLDILGVVLLLIATAIALYQNAFEGVAGSVYFGRGVELNHYLLVFPLVARFAGSFFSMRLYTSLIASLPAGNGNLGVRPWSGIFRLSLVGRPWPIGNGAVIVSLIVALAISLSAFTASYNQAKADDARFANGADIRITPGLTNQNQLPASDSSLFQVEGIADVTAVIYGVQNVILRSNRTSDPANLVAVNPRNFGLVAPLHDSDFVEGSSEDALEILRNDHDATLLNVEMANFLKQGTGDMLYVLLLRGSSAQIEIPLRVSGLFHRLPGSPDGAHALLSIDHYLARAPTKKPDFFLANTMDGDPASLDKALASLVDGPGNRYELRIDSRLTTLARDQSSLAALNIAGLVQLDSVFSLAMAAVTVGIFIFGLLLQRRREYVTLRAQGAEPSRIRLLIAAEASVIALGGGLAGILVGVAMGFYFTRILQPLFVHVPTYVVPLQTVVVPILLVCIKTLVSSVICSRLVNGFHPMELLRDE